MKNARNVKYLLFLIGASFMFALSTFAQPEVAIGQLADRLRATPSDNALREQIIKLAAEMKPSPEIPEEARGFFVEGTTLAKAAKDVDGQKLAIDRFNSALKIAPWWDMAYYNLSIAQEIAGQFDEAQSSLKFYILSNPGEKETREAKDKIYALRARKALAEAETAQKEAQRKAAEDTPEAREKKFFDSLEGAVFYAPLWYGDKQGGQTRTMRDWIFVRNRELVFATNRWWSPSQLEPGIDQVREEKRRIPLTGRSIRVAEGQGMPCSDYLWVIEEQRISGSWPCTGKVQIVYTRAR